MCRVFLALLLGAIFSKEASAAQHVVGGSQGWVESADLSSWASGETFKVGDQLGKVLELIFLIKLRFHYQFH